MSLTGVPYSAIDRFEEGFQTKWLKQVEELSRTCRFIGGPTLKTLEKKLAAAAETKEARVCANGTDAIQIALRALGVGEGDCVLIPDLTFWATFESVVNVGARPVTLDVELKDVHPSVEMYESAIEKFKPKAAILVHLYGWAATDTLAIRELCKRKNVLLMEDSAQAWGTRLNGKSIFADALVSTTSFYPGKVLGAAGDGGALFTNDSHLAEEMWSYANHGRLDKYTHKLIGWNSRLDCLQGAYVELSLDYTPERIKSRRFAANWYRENVKIPGIEFRSPPPGVDENGYISVAFVDPAIRPKLMQYLDQSKIGYAVVYPGPMHAQPGAKGWTHGVIDRGNSAKICASIINLPCFAGQTVQELEYVAHHLKEFFRGNH